MGQTIVTVGGVAIPSLGLIRRTNNRAWRFEEQRTIADKTKLQAGGKEPGSEEWELSLVAAFCDPEAIKTALEAKADVKKPEPLPVVWSDGTMTGTFVIEKISTTYEQTDEKGAVIHSKISLTLKQVEPGVAKPSPAQSAATEQQQAPPGGGTSVFGIDLDKALQNLGNYAVGQAEEQARQAFRGIVADEIRTRIPSTFADMQSLAGVLRTPGFAG
jgi:phage protein U